MAIDLGKHLAQAEECDFSKLKFLGTPSKADCQDRVDPRGEEDDIPLCRHSSPLHRKGTENRPEQNSPAI